MGAKSDKDDRKKKVYYYIWVDAKIDNMENSKYAKGLSKIYSHISFFNNVQDGMKCLQDIKFKWTYFIVSGSLFVDCLSQLKSIENKISTCPKLIIFTSESTKEKIKNLKEINNSLPLLLKK